MSGTTGLWDVIICGSGPAGLTAAIYTSREGYDTLVMAGETWGGQLMLTSLVENFPGFPEGTSGNELMSLMMEQARHFGATLLDRKATSVDFAAKPFKVTTGEESCHGRSVIIATGATPRWLGLESERRLIGRGVSTCATCDAPFYKKATVVGGGDTAMEEALHLAKFADEVIIVHRRDKLRASKTLQERVFANPRIEILWNSVVVEILGAYQVDGVRVKTIDKMEERILECQGVVVAIGHDPNTEPFRGQVELDERGYIKARNLTETSVRGVFAAGDVQDSIYRQAVYAAGLGCRAAIDVRRYLESNGN